MVQHTDRGVRVHFITQNNLMLQRLEIHEVDTYVRMDTFCDFLAGANDKRKRKKPYWLLSVNYGVVTKQAKTTSTYSLGSICANFRALELLVDGQYGFRKKPHRIGCFLTRWSSSQWNWR